MKRIDIQELLDAANGEGFSPEQLAGVALLLSEYRGEIDDALESLKDKLRTWAVTLRQEGESHIMFEGIFPHDPCGRVQVTFMEPSLKLKKGVDLSSVSGLERLVEERVTLSPMGNVIELLGLPENSHLVEYFDVVESKPRVGFRKT